MSDKPPENVNIITGDVSGDTVVIGIGNTVTKIVNHPAEWQDAVFRFYQANRGFLFTLLTAEIALGALYIVLRNRYLIPYWVGVLAIGLLAVTAWGWYALVRGDASLRRKVYAPASTVGLLVLLGWQGVRIASPPEFSPQTYGIAIATFGSGDLGWYTPRSLEITNQAFLGLSQAIEAEFAGDTGGSCDPAADASSVAVQRIGVMRTPEQAQAYGRRIRADIVVWGEVLTTQEGTVTVRFTLLETADRALNPDSPLVLPLTLASTEIFESKRSISAGTVEVDRIVTQQSTAIASFALGLSSYLRQDYRPAVCYFEKVDDQLDDNPDLVLKQEGQGLIFYYLGRALQRFGEIEAGNAALEQAQAANSSEPAVPISLALGYRSLGLDDDVARTAAQAFDMLDEWLADNPQDSAAFYDRGVVFLIEEDYREALLDFERAIEIEPEFLAAHILAASALTELERFEEAEARLQEAASIADSSGADPSAVLLNLALLYEQMDRPTAAREAYLATLDANPRYEFAYYHYALFLEEDANEPDAALQTFRQLADLAENKGWAYGHLAAYQRRLGLLDAAADSYVTAIQYRRGDALLHTYLGEVYMELGEEQAGIESFEDALEEDTRSSYPYASFATWMFRIGEVERAAALYEQALDLKPDDPPVILNLGAAYETLGDPQSAAQTYSLIVCYTDTFPEDIVEEANRRVETLSLPAICEENQP